MTIKNIPVGYKDSPLGIIPMEWEVKRLGELSEINPNKGEITSKFVTFLAMSDISEQGRVINENIVSTDSIKSGFTPFKRNDIIVAKITPCFENGKGALLNNITEEYGFGSTEFHVIRCQQCNRFIYYHTISYPFRKRLESQMTGSAGQKRVSADSISSYKIPLPPLSEQEKIAEILSTWDKAIEKQIQLIQKLELRKKGLMQQLLTGKKRLPGFTGEWKKVKLGEISKRVTRKNDTNCQNVVTISAQKGFVRQTDFFKKIVASKTTEQYYLVKRDEFCYNKSYSNGFPMGAIKRLVEFEEAVVTTLYICFVIESDIASIDFIEQYFSLGLLNNGLRKVANEGGRAHGLLNVTPYDFFDLKMFLPSLQEQTAIANILSSCDEEIRLAQDKLAAMKEQKKGLMQVLLTGKRRVKL